MRCKACGKKMNLFKLTYGMCPECYEDSQREQAEKRAAAKRHQAEEEIRQEELSAEEARKQTEAEELYDLLAQQLEDIEADSIQVDDTPVTGTEAAIKLIIERRLLCSAIKETVQKLYDYPADDVMRIIIAHATERGSCYASDDVSCFFWAPLDAEKVVSDFVKAVQRSGDDNWEKYFKLGRAFDERLKFERALAELQPTVPETNDSLKYPRLKGSDIHPITISRIMSNTDYDSLADFVAIYAQTQGRNPYVKIRTLEAVRFVAWEPEERLILHFDVENKTAEQFSSYIDALKQFIGGYRIVSYDTYKTYSAFFCNGYDLHAGFGKRKYYDISTLAENYRKRVNGFYGTDIDSLCEATDLRFKYMEKPAGADSMALGFLFKFYAYEYTKGF